jgi:S1-C subfamily serine protease
MSLNKAILAVSIVLAGIGILFAYSQFADFGIGRGISLPIDFGQQTDSGLNDREDVEDDAFRIGQVSTVEASNSELSLPDLFTKVEKSVVQITDSSETSALESRLGSGFVYDNNGHIITNYHVVNGGGRLDVTFLDGTVYRASLLGSDPFTDLAVLYVEDVPEGKLVPLPLADSTQIRVGEQVAAIGNPFGLSGSMSAGIVSGLGRLIPSQEAGSFSIPDVIQTDAPINPGNSGGPLLNMRGEVIGINSAIFSTTGQFAGVGFAIPSNTMTNVVPALITDGSFTHPWLGVSGTDMTPGIAQALGLEEPRGFLVVDVVAGSPAERAGIQGGSEETTVDGRPIALGGDVIVSIDDRQVRKIDDILVYLQREKSVGDELKLTVLRDGNLIDITATLAARPSLQESP